MLSLRQVKKLIVAIAVLVYFVINTGFVVSVHYCMNKFQSSQIGADDHKKCGSCGMPKQGGCCHDEVKVVKLASDHMVTQTVSASFSPLLPVILTTFSMSNELTRSQSLLTVSTHPP